MANLGMARGGYPVYGMTMQPVAPQQYAAVNMCQQRLAAEAAPQVQRRPVSDRRLLAVPKTLLPESPVHWPSTSQSPGKTPSQVQSQVTPTRRVSVDIERMSSTASPQGVPHFDLRMDLVTPKGTGPLTPGSSRSTQVGSTPRMDGDSSSSSCAASSSLPSPIG